MIFTGAIVECYFIPSQISLTCGEFFPGQAEPHEPSGSLHGIEEEAIRIHLKEKEDNFSELELAPTVKSSYVQLCECPSSLPRVDIL